jgi:hypothetical protein
MMVVLTAKHIDMQRHAARLRKALQTMRDHLGRKGADLGVVKVEGADEIRPRRDVDDGARQRLVKRRKGVPEARDARAGA